jgi:hypothetical protein
LFSKLMRWLGVGMLSLAYVMLLGIEYVVQGPRWWYRGAERTLRDAAQQFEKMAKSFDEDFIVTLFFASVCMGLFLYVCWIALYTLFAS